MRFRYLTVVIIRITSYMGFRCTGGEIGFLVHDASTLAFLFYPETVRCTRAQVKISTEGCDGVRGLSYFDRRHATKQGGGTWVRIMC
jgi:purine nucleosidase